MQPERIQDLEVLLGHSFRDKDFLLNALSHSSIKTERRPSNERLEFLGDSVLGLIVSDALYRRFPEDDEGTLTRIKSHAVSRSTLQRVAMAMGLDRFILVGKGVAKREIPASLLGNLFEAIVGAIYLDAGLAAARKFVMRHLDIIVDEIVEDRAERNYKSMLQHYCQREKGGVPTYRVLQESGPAHHRAFDVAVILNGREFGRARGISKKEAEQGSARAAMIHFRAIDE
ncbi:MAG: ribonuclease III, partial [Planctomycetota bacterium]